MKGPVPRGHVRETVPEDLSKLNAIVMPSARHAREHTVPGRVSGPLVLPKQMSLEQFVPENGTRGWEVVQVHSKVLAGEPVVGPGMLAVKPPGPAEGQAKSNASPPVLLTTVLTTVIGPEVLTLTSHWLSAPLAATPSRSRGCTDEA